MMAKSVVGAFEALLSLNAGTFNEGLRAAAKNVDSFANKANKTMETVNKGFSGVSLAVKGFVAAFAIDKIVDFTRFADGFSLLQARIKGTVASQQEYIQASQSIAQISINTGVALDSTVQVFQRLSMSLRSLGRDNEEVLKLTELVNQLGVVSGASGEAMKAGLLQFGQAMGSGIVRAEEFNSIVENIPAVAQKIAEGFETTVPGLRKMVLEGKLLSSDVMDALLAQSNDINAEFAKMPLTFDRVANKGMLAFQSIAGAIDKGTNASADFYGYLNRAIDRVLFLNTASGDTGIKIVRLFIDVGKSIGYTLQLAASNFMDFIGSMLSGLTGLVAGSVRQVNSLLSMLPGIKNPLGGALGGITGFEQQLSALNAAGKQQSKDIGSNLQKSLKNMFNPGRAIAVAPQSSFKQYRVFDSQNLSSGGGGSGRGSGGRGGGESKAQQEAKKETERLKEVAKNLSETIAGGFKGANLTDYYKKIAEITEAHKKGFVSAMDFANAVKAIDASINEAINQVTQGDFDKIWDAKVVKPIEAFSDDIMDGFDEGVNKIQEDFAGLSAFLEQSKTPLETYNEEVLKLGQWFSEGAISQLQFSEGIKVLDENLAKANGTFIDWEGTVGGWANTFIDSLARGQFEFKNFAASILADIARMILQFTVLNQVKKLFENTTSSASGGIFGKIIGGIGKAFGGFFAEGGSPPVGVPSIVGERGPELFVPKQAGSVIPNEMLAMAGGGQTITQNFYINATDPMTFKQQLQREAAMIGNIGLQFTQAAANKRGKRGPLD